MIARSMWQMVSSAIAVAVLLCAASPVRPAQPGGGIGFKEYIQAVIEGNVGLASQKFSVDVADAAIAVAGLAPDPTFMVGYSSYELSRINLPRSTIAALNYTFENPDKRRARVLAAEADKSLAEAQLNEYMKTLRLDAANAFIESLRAREILARRKYALGLFENIEQQSAKPSKDAAPLQALERSQLRLELSRLRGDFFQAESDAAIADRNLSFYLGESKLNRPAIYASANLEISEIQFVEADLQESALSKRPDLASAGKALQSARAKSKLAQENRKLDLGFTVGVTHTQPLWAIPDAGGTYSPGSYPMSNGMIATVTIPMPFSLLQDGDLRGPAATATQAEMRLREMQGKARIESQQALIKYRLSHKQVAAYRAGTADADILMQDTLKKFAGKETGFPDIVYYVRTANEVYFAYLEALAASAKALISVYQASGLWQFEL